LRCANLARNPFGPVGSQEAAAVNSPIILNTSSFPPYTLRLRSPPPRSYYAASSPETARPPRPPLTGGCRVDVAVVGGGVAGCSAALHFAQRGYGVALLEAHRVGFGASGRSGGQLIFGLAVGQKPLIAQVGRENARRLFDMSVEALDLTQSLIRDHAIECDYRPNHVHVATKPRHLEELRDWQHELHDEYDYRSARFLDRAELAEHVRSDRYLGGLIDPRSGHLHPLKYTQGLARAAEAAGARIFEQTTALSFAEGAEVTVHTERGMVRCRHLVLCANAYVGMLSPRLARRILGVGTYIIATRPMDEARARALLPSDAAIADLNWILDYFRLSADRRLLFGGRVSYSALQPPRLAESMHRRLARIFPQAADLEVEYAWGGYLDITMSRAPDFGRLAPNIFYLQGFSGHGMSLTALAGKLVAEAVSGTAERFDVFARLPHRDFPGGALLRRPSLVLAMLYYRVKDLL
jgi:gamma-glutamylputrescine oxidase